MFMGYHEYQIKERLRIALFLVELGDLTRNDFLNIPVVENNDRKVNGSPREGAYTI